MYLKVAPISLAHQTSHLLAPNEKPLPLSACAPAHESRGLGPGLSHFHFQFKNSSFKGYHLLLLYGSHSVHECSWLRFKIYNRADEISEILLGTSPGAEPLSNPLCHLTDLRHGEGPGEAFRLCAQVP